MKKIFKLFVLAAAVFAASCSGEKNFSKADLEIIRNNPDKLLQIYTTENPEELEVLRAYSYDLSEKAIHSEDFKLLSDRMLRVLQDSVVGGLGMSAPQIGINKSVIAVCRVDKPGAPCEIYPNIKIVANSEEIDIQIEGCLSVPGKRDYIDRAMGVEIEYYSPENKKIVRDTVIGYVARIFQHEVDHLEGRLFTDRAY